MKSSSAASKQGSRTWSQRIEERYALRLGDELADWFDTEMWSQPGQGEFNQTVSADRLLAETPDVIWPGLMLPDTLPILGNRYGDWLCLRVGEDDRVSEVIHWYHGGGDWIPWGSSLAEAIAFDMIRQRLPGRRQGHAVSAEPRREGDFSGQLAQWAGRRLGKSAFESLAELTPSALAQRFLDRGISEVAVRCELALAALDSEIRRILTPELASELGVAWESEAVGWMFDGQRVEPAMRRRIAERAGRSISFEQDWATAAEHARAVCAMRTDLGWAFDLAGWAEERKGNLSDALPFYSQGSMTLAFADQSIRFRTHWFPPGHGKFSLWRAQAIGLPEEPSESRTRNFVDAVRDSHARELRSVARDYWVAVAKNAIGESHPAEAYDAYYRSGWDLGVDAMAEYRASLQGLVQAAEAAGQRARARVAQTHYDAFLTRFGG